MVLMSWVRLSALTTLSVDFEARIWYVGFVEEVTPITFILSASLRSGLPVGHEISCINISEKQIQVMKYDDCSGYLASEYGI
jgi:hypothetical protein